MQRDSNNTIRHKVEAKMLHTWIKLRLWLLYSFSKFRTSSFSVRLLILLVGPVQSVFTFALLFLLSLHSLLCRIIICIHL